MIVTPRRIFCKKVLKVKGLGTSIPGIAAGRIFDMNEVQSW
jgi:hypothetical protein